MPLLLIIYLAFISLGLPDGVLGSIWPVMRQDLGLPLYSAGFIGAVVSVGTVISALNSYRLIYHHGTGKVTLVSVFLTALALLGFSFAPNLPVLLLWAVPLGLGAGSVDAALNNYVALHYQARHMNWLHSFWGLGASTGPLVMGMVLSLQYSYRFGYRLLGGFQLILVVVLLLSIRRWEAPHKPDLVGHASEPEQEPVKQSALALAMLGFFLYCALEVSTGLWAVSYLVEVKALDATEAAFYGSLFFLGITSGRMLSGFVSFRLSNTALIKGGLLVCLVGIMLLFFSSLQTSGFSLLLLGLGCAPVFPSMIHETPRRFGVEQSQRIIGLEMAAAYVGSTVTPPLFGLLALVLGLAWMPALQVFILFLLFLSIQLIKRFLNT
ncbi:MFS transporter [Sphaerochaeta sp.]|uniref:MFS transporter n=1 Tax=Sphaerochaeta sp. TaxID=1972642 RepID=UPI002FC5FEA7